MMESTNPHQDYRVEPLLRASDLCEGDVVLDVHVSHCQQFTRQRGSTLIVKVLIVQSVVEGDALV